MTHRNLVDQNFPETHWKDKRYEETQLLSARKQVIHEGIFGQRRNEEGACEIADGEEARSRNELLRFERWRSRRQGRTIRMIPQPQVLSTATFELKARLSEILSRVLTTGEEVTITRHRVPIARIVPIEPKEGKQK
jgi:prevent-host-death family protein